MRKKVLLLLVAALFAFQNYIHSQGTRYTGPYTPSQAIVWVGVTDQEISGLSFTNLQKTNIELNQCSNITIRNCKFSKSVKESIYALNVKNLTIEDCVFDSIDGVFIAAYAGSPFNGGTCSGVKIRNCYFKNTVGENAPHNHAIQFAGVNGGGQNEISNNSFEMLNSNVDDIISLYASYGSANDSIVIKNNWLRGGNATTGSGIMIGDYGGSYFHVLNNVLVNIVSCGIGNAGASNSTVENNVILQEKTYSVSNTGVGIFSTNFDYPRIDCSSNTVKKNRAYYVLNNGTINNFGASNNCGVLSGWDTNISDPNLTADILPQDISVARVKGVTTESTIKDTETNFKFYPNPANDHFTIESSTTDINNGVVTVFNINGQKLLEQNLNNQFTEISTNNLAVGVYIVKVTSAGKEIENKKLIVNKN